MPRRHAPKDFYVDANDCLTERVVLGGQEVEIHYDDLPESDITTVDGIRCTTPVRTLIDLAAQLDPAELRRIVDDGLERRLFTRDQAIARIAQPDMVHRRGAHLLRQALL